MSSREGSVLNMDFFAKGLQGTYRYETLISKAGGRSTGGRGQKAGISDSSVPQYLCCYHINSKITVS